MSSTPKNIFVIFIPFAENYAYIKAFSKRKLKSYNEKNQA